MTLYDAVDNDADADEFSVDDDIVDDNINHMLTHRQVIQRILLEDREYESQADSEVMQNESRADSDDFARADLLEINENIKDGIEINNDASLNEKFEVKEKVPMRKENGGICEIDEFDVENFNSDVFTNILNPEEDRNDDISLDKKAERYEYDIHNNCEGYNLPKFEELVREMSWEVEKSLIIHSSEEHNQDPDINDNFDVNTDADEFSIDDDPNVGETNIDENSDVDEFNFGDDTNMNDSWNKDSDIDDLDSGVDSYEFDVDGIKNLKVKNMTVVNEMSNIKEFDIEKNERLVFADADAKDGNVLTIVQLYENDASEEVDCCVASGVCLA